jgi:hypothetical protein
LIIVLDLDFKHFHGLSLQKRRPCILGLILYRHIDKIWQFNKEKKGTCFQGNQYENSSILHDLAFCQENTQP